MSYSTTVKNEVCRLINEDKCCQLSEFASILKIGGIIFTKKENVILIKLTTENSAFARRVFLMLKELLGLFPQITIRRNKKLKKHVLYVITIPFTGKFAEIINIIGIKYEENKKLQYNCYINKKELFKKKCCKRAYLRGAFLSSGSLNDPEKSYHLEINSRNVQVATELSEIMNSYNLNSKVLKRKGSYVVYLKEGENIVDFLNIIGAHIALCELENVRILKDMRNNVNRIVNCETANLEKTVEASVRQNDNIKLIKNSVEFEGLHENLREIAELRLEHIDASLKELGNMLNPPLGKSGVNHRLRKLDDIAKKIRDSKGAS